ncbi:OmpA family protein [Prevotella lacticifex]|uniref:PorE family type IX secretion system protein n=1 Tax=Prevotella lacticifex TaxID=2854755 RepID=UPI001CC62FA6|nr:OmpA family protein [Prevotella lacticifex]MDY6266992.1 OmpA family protein [Prevotella sp.]
MELKSIIQHRHSTDGGRPNVGWILVVILLLGFVSCGADRNIKKGDKYLSLGEYYDAAEQYKQAYRRIPPKERKARGQVSKKIALANDYINSSAKAIAAYRNVIRYHQDSPETHLKLAGNLMKQGQYGDAAKEYQIVLDSLPGNKAAKEGLLAASEAPAEKKNASKYIVKKMDVFNSRRSDYSPMLFGDQYDQLYFTSTRNEAQGDELSGITGVKPGDIFYSEKDDKGHWGRPQTIESGLNTEFDEGTPAFSPDGREMYITQCTTDPSYPRYAKIAVSNRADASWGKATPLEISRDTLSSFAHPAISPDGNWLYFVSDMPGGKGGLDIWRVRLIGGTTGGVENLGEPINTPGDEEFPTFRPNGDLYFSSNGHGGLGGLDIFIAKVGKDHKFHLEHPGYPLNSQGDDFGCTFEGPHNRGFFSSNRGDARGWDHIYSFELPEIVQTVKGWVYEMEGYELPAAQVYMVGDDGTNLKLSVKGDGSFEQVIKPGVDYIMLASCKGYLNHKEELKVDSVSESKEYTLQFPLASIRVPVMIDNIFYDFDKATLRPESKKALDELVKLLNDNPNVTIELSAHCDYKGPAEYNKKLSQERANNVVAYLTEHGIAKDRLTPVGYGKEKPKTVRKKLTEKYPWLKENDVLTEDFIKKLDKDKQEICNQLNRRTEFIVLRTTYGMFDEKGNLKNPPKPKPQEEKSSDDNTYDIEIN